MVKHKSLYLSKAYDGDLRALYGQVGRTAFVKMVKESLRMMLSPSYKPEVIGVTKVSPLQKDDFEEKSLFLSLTFGEKKDADILRLLDSCERGKMGFLIKGALRFAIGPYYCLSYYLAGNESINERLVQKEMFFIGTIPQVQKIQVVKEIQVEQPVAEVPKTEEPKKPAKFVEEPELPPVSIFKEPPALEPVEAPENTSGELSDDEILALLENM